MRKFIVSITLGLMASCLTTYAGVLATTTNTVLKMTGKISVVTQGGDNSTPTILKVNITQNDIINLARGRARLTPVPANEVLALANDCSEGPVKLIVFDTIASSNLVQLSSTTLMTGAEQGNKSVNGILFQIDSVGAPTNGIAGGVILLTVNATEGTNGCPTSLSGAIAGILEVVTSEPDVNTNDLLITKGKISASVVGTLIEPSGP